MGCKLFAIAFWGNGKVHIEVLRQQRSVEASLLVAITLCQLV